jgi:hypothetical protein
LGIFTTSALITAEMMMFDRVMIESVLGASQFHFSNQAVFRKHFMISVNCPLADP